jgi:hypothetical protein
MESSIKIGTRRLSRDLVAFIAPAQPDPSRVEPFHSWVTLTNGSSFGAVETPEQIAKANGFSYLDKDRVAINRGADIRVRTYVASRNAADVKAPPASRSVRRFRSAGIVIAAGKIYQPSPTRSPESFFPTPTSSPFIATTFQRLR